MNGLLIVDDEEGVRRALHKALAKENYQIYSASDGNEAISLVKQKADGLTRKLCCLTLSDNRVVALGKEPIREESGRIVGWVSSGGYGYSVGQSIVYAYLPMECTKVGTRLEIECFGEQVAATVTQSPLWDPKGERIRA